MEINCTVCDKSKKLLNSVDVLDFYKYIVNVYTEAGLAHIESDTLLVLSKDFTDRNLYFVESMQNHFDLVDNRTLIPYLKTFIEVLTGKRFSEVPNNIGWTICIENMGINLAYLSYFKYSKYDPVEYELNKALEFEMLLRMTHTIIFIYKKDLKLEDIQ
jgi:hypothetical protein